MTLDLAIRILKLRTEAAASIESYRPPVHSSGLEDAIAMSQIPGNTQEQSRPGFGGVRDTQVPRAFSPPAGIDHLLVPIGTGRRSRRRPDYRLRGLDLDAQSPDAPIGPPRRVRPRRRRRHLLIKWVVILAMTAVVAMLLRAFVVQPYSVPSAAMAPTLQVGDQILVVKSSLMTRPVQRGEIVVFHRPNYVRCLAGGSATERVVGLPGETIWSAGDAIYVDNHRLNEQGWYNPTAGQVGSTPIHRTRIPSGDYFMLGDNRADSCDSRAFGAVSGSSIVGQVKAVVLRHGHPYIHLLSNAL